MVRGLYTAGTGMMLQRRRMETITNNVTNADTVGFKAEHLISHSFDDVMVQRINDSLPLPGVRASVAHRSLVGPMSLGTQVDHLYINFEQGAIEGTERTTDFAIVGDGFFVVQTPYGERYTRSGAFFLDNEGFLVDGDGNYLLGATGPINAGSLNFSVDQFGNVFNEAGHIDTIRIVSFEDNSTLRRQGGNLYFATVPPLAAHHPVTVLQGFLENSNVDIGREMVDMITTFRAYETNQRMISMIDETVGRAVNEIGRLR